MQRVIPAAEYNNGAGLQGDVSQARTLVPASVPE